MSKIALTNIACVLDEKTKASGEDVKAKAQWRRLMHNYVVSYGYLLILS